MVFSAWRREGCRQTLIIAAFQYLKGPCKAAGEGHITRACSDRTRGSSFKLRKSRFRLDIRKEFLTVRMLRYWHTLPRKAVDVPYLELFGWGWMGDRKSVV